MTQGAQNQPLAFLCPECGVPRPFTLASEHSRYQEDAGIGEVFSYVVCTVCSAPMLLIQEDYGNDLSRHRQLYPVLRRQIQFPVPHAVLASYDEAVKCETARAWMGSAVMVGRALEAICKDFDPATGTIQDGLRKMLDAGAISQEMHDWGDSLRVVRNAGAHASPDRVSADDARHALDFLQALLEILFDLRVRFAEWQVERATRAAGRKPRTLRIPKEPERN